MPYQKNGPVPTGWESKRLACEELYRLGLMAEEIRHSMRIPQTHVHRILDAYKRNTSGIERPFSKERAYAMQMSRFVELWPEIRGTVIDVKAARRVSEALQTCLQIEYYTNMLTAVIWARYIESQVPGLVYDNAAGEALECVTRYLQKIRTKSIPPPKNPAAFRDELIKQFYWNGRVARRTHLTR